MDWAYGQFGAYAMSTELWNWRSDTKGLPGFSGEDDRALWEGAYIEYQEQAFGGKAFIPWQPFDHPELGEGEIGGWTSKYRSSNAIPGDSLRHVCETHWQFELFKAKLLPRVEITQAEARVLYTTDSASQARADRDADSFTVNKGSATGKYKIVEVKATLENTGQLPTHVARGFQLAGNREDAVWLLGDRDKIAYLQGAPWISIGVLDGTMDIPGYDPDAAPASTTQAGSRRMMPPMMPGRPGMPGMFQRGRGMAADEPQIKKTGSTREITWLVAIEGDTPLKVILTSQKGGTKVQEITIN
jgi:hypothetical protein